MIDELIVDVIRGVVDSMNKDESLMCYLQKVSKGDIKELNYQHGHYQEIANTLLEYKDSYDFYEKTYPIIALFEDVRYSIVNGIYEAQISLVIGYKSESTLRSKDRYNEVINPILLPIYETFKRKLYTSGKFMNYEFDHDMIVRPYYGVENPQGDGTKRNTANIFNDILDCIEIRNLRLKLYPNNCKVFTNCN